MRWLKQIAPVAWWIKGHVRRGREAPNFSEWESRPGDDTEDAAETVRDGSMPPGYYTWLGMHSGAKLTAAERRELADGLARTLRQSRPGGD